MIMRRIKQADAPEARKQTVQEQITEIAKSILATIENGYEKSSRADWNKLHIPVMNAATRHFYTGGNRWLLNDMSKKHGWADPRFVTFKQCGTMEDADGNRAHIKKGERAVRILRPVPFEKKLELPDDIDPDFESGIIEEDGKRYAKIKMVGFQCISVFNIAQTTIKASPLPGLTPRDWTDCDFFERFVEASGVAVKNDHPSKAYYSPEHNVIHMPSKDAFHSADQYYASLLHEFFHATGHQDRMNRGFSPAKDERYAMEELRAELFSIACVEMFGLDYPREKQAGYIDYWASAIEEGKAKTILKAANDVDAVLGTLLDAASGKQPKLSWFPEIDFSGFPTPLKKSMETADEIEATRNRPGLSDREICRAILPEEQFAALERGANGKEPGVYLDIMREIAENARAVPAIYVQEPYGEDATAFMRISGVDGSEYYLTELGFPTDTAYGYAVDETGFAMLGEIPLAALRTLNGRLDIEFSPATVSEIAKQYEPQSPEEIGEYGDPSADAGDDDHHTFSMCM